MHVGKHYSLKEILNWTKREILIFILLAAIPTLLYSVCGVTWIAVPWLPIALIGTAVAFVVGFKNNASYARLWEARQIWGSIVNNSRSWAMLVKTSVTQQSNGTPPALKMHRRLIYRHIAWLTALRFQLRQPRPWENLTKQYNAAYRKNYTVHELESNMEQELAALLSTEDLAYVLSKTNVATHLVGLQSKELLQLHNAGFLNEFPRIQLDRLLTDLYNDQGKCERIKNFPYPRQFATINLFFVRLFILLVPFGMVAEFENLGSQFVWLTIPFSTLVSWVFHTMEKIGESSENPFEGMPNDIPMASLCRTIEIDLREMLDETQIPSPIQVTNNILM